MKGKVLAVIGIVYIILSVFVTKFLLDRNDYGVFETKDNYYICNEAIKEYGSTTLVKFNKNADYTTMINEKVYYFDESEIKNDTLAAYDKDGKVFTIGDTNHEIDSLLGKPEKGYALVGGLLNFLTTKIFYLIFIIVPVVCLLVYEIYLLVKYIRNGKDNNNEKIVDKK